MHRPLSSPLTPGCRPRRGRVRPVWIVVVLLSSGCRNGARPWAGLAADDAHPPTGLRDAETAFTWHRSDPEPLVERAPETRIDVLLRVLYVQVPRSQRDQTAGVWDHLREDALDSETRRRLHRNGVRVGLGRTERWDTIKDRLNEIAGYRVHEFPPLRTPPEVPLALEFDVEPVDHTIFYLDGDGILSGDTWPASQRVLRVTYTLDTRDTHRVFLSVVPEIRRQLDPEWSYTEDGWTTGPRRTGRAFAAAAFAVALEPNEFVLLAPGEKADLFGLVGGAFLADRVDNQPYDSYVFLRTDIAHVNERR